MAAKNPEDALFILRGEPEQPPELNVRRLYELFDLPLAGIDCGTRCAPHNPTGKPFCCDICQAVPAAYSAEWDYLRERTDLWHAWRGDECPSDPGASAELRAETPEHMLLLACKGPAHCQRPFRALSCRQFPFFPYITADDRFIGLAYEWEFEAVCWVISNLGVVSDAYRQAFVATFDAIFDSWPDEFESYALRSEQARRYFTAQRRRIPILHRRGGIYLVSPGSERMVRTISEQQRKFGPYHGAG